MILACSSGRALEGHYWYLIPVLGLPAFCVKSTYDKKEYPRNYQEQLCDHFMTIVHGCRNSTHAHRPGDYSNICPTALQDHQPLTRMNHRLRQTRPLRRIRLRVVLQLSTQPRPIESFATVPESIRYVPLRCKMLSKSLRRE